jgi:hypothetical protein
MFLHDILNGRAVPVGVLTGAVPATSPRQLSNNPRNVGNFSTLESLFSFSGATAVVVAFAKGFPTLLGAPSLPIFCIVAGALIWLFNITDPKVNPPPTARDKFFGAVLAAVNTFQMYLACLGAKMIVG